MKKNSYAVIGLGTFGQILAEELVRNGSQVLVCDINTQRVETMRDKVTETVITDASSEDAIRELQVERFDAVILGMASYFEKQMLALTLLKQYGAKKIIVKSSTPLQQRILNMLGADEVIQPEVDVAQRLAKKLSVTNLIDITEFKGAALAEIHAPDFMCNHSLQDLNLRRKFGVTVLLRSSKGQNVPGTLSPTSKILEGDVLTIFGDRDAVMKMVHR